MNSLVQCQTCYQFFPNTGSLSRHMLVHKNNKGIGSGVGLSFNPLNSVSSAKKKKSGEKSEKFENSERPIEKLDFENLDMFSAEKLVSELTNKILSHTNTDIDDLGSVLSPNSVILSLDNQENSLDTTNSPETKTYKIITNENGRKSYECNICEKQFTTLYNLKAHTGIHTGKKPFACKFCGKDFLRKYKLV